MNTLPSAVLFACTTNAIRSPMAEAIAKHHFGHKIYVDSVGLRKGETDEFAVAVLLEIGIDLSRHRPKSFDELQDTFYDLVITLSPQAQHRAVELTRTMATEVEFWNTFDPSLVEGNREARLDAYRGVRDTLIKRILARFPAEARQR